VRRIWFIDDREDNREAWIKGFGSEIRAHCELQTFGKWLDLRQQLETVGYPDVLFVDFFIYDFYGHEVISWIDIHSPGDQRPVIVAHSSNEYANVGMVNKYRADCRLEKTKGETVSSSIQAHFKSLADIEYLIKYRDLKRRTQQQDEEDSW
jgi:DNA-binding NtrC family response regulator